MRRKKECSEILEFQTALMLLECFKWTLAMESLTSLQADFGHGVFDISSSATLVVNRLHPRVKASRGEAKEYFLV